MSYRMITAELAPRKTSISKRDVDQQLQKIVCDPIFADSAILKRFLIYVVTEALNGHSNKIKEYTIAVNVLNKPSDFKTQESGIVRIHAGRLRRALDFYYCERGVLDIVRISIPKGSYVPVFDEMDEGQDSLLMPSRKVAVVGVAPFRDSTRDGLSASFVDCLGVQLSTALMHFGNFSVVAHSAMRSLFAKLGDIDEVARMVGANLLITGDLQTYNGSLRVHTQFIRIRTSQLLWSQMYELKCPSENTFELQDRIVNMIMSDLEGLAI